MSTTWPGSSPGSIAGRADEALLDTYEQERRPVGVAATADSVAQPRGNVRSRCRTGVTAASGTYAASSSSPPSRHWVPRRPVRAVIRGLTTLGYQRLRLAKSAGRIGQRIRRRAAAAIARQGPHYRSWGRDLGVHYRRGALMGDRLPPPVSDPEFYITICARRRPAAAQLARGRRPAGVHPGSGQPQ